MRLNSHNANNLNVVVAHLNAPHGVVVGLEQLACVLRTGSVDVLSPKDKAVPIISALFLKVDPLLILASAKEAGADVNNVHALYLEGLAPGMTVVPAWGALCNSSCETMLRKLICYAKS